MIPPPVPLRWAPLALLLLACGPSEPPAERSTPDSTPPAPVVGAPRALPPVGIAVLDTAGRWCAAFPNAAAELGPGARVTIVFAGDAEVPAWRAAVERLRDAQCPAAFAQSRWTDYRAYDLALIDSLRPSAAPVPLATLAVAGEASWVRGADGRVRADLDGDGSVEEARVCRADEGHHFTIWSDSGGSRRRRAHEYYDWGALVDPTCQAEESAEAPDPGAT